MTPAASTTPQEQDAGWMPPPRVLSLSAAEVHLWRGSLDASPAVVRRCAACLADDETERAGRFHFDDDRHRFTVGRAFLRHVLARYMNLAPAAVRFDYSRFGKPSLSAAHPAAGLSFNLSHAAGLALLAVTRRREIGVDVEKIRPDFPSDEIARRFFSAHEVAVLETIPLAAMPVAFFNCWTRKEAYIKGRGEGLSIPLGSFDVTLRPGEPARLLADRRDPAAVEQWALKSFEPAEGYVGAVAIAVRGSRYRYYHWTWT